MAIFGLTFLFKIGSYKGNEWAAVHVKVTVQFETQGNGQNEIFSHMDRSEIRLYNNEKEIL